MADHPMRRASDQRVFRFDGTINIPTIVTLAAALVAGIQTYNSLDRRTENNTKDIMSLQAQHLRFEQALTSARSDQAVQVQQVKTEIRSDLSEIKSTLNGLVMSQLNRPRKEDSR